MASSDQPLAASAPDMAPMRWPRSVRSATEASGMVEGEGSGATAADSGHTGDPVLGQKLKKSYPNGVGARRACWRAKMVMSEALR